jgi:hypothetical protein
MNKIPFVDLLIGQTFVDVNGVKGVKADKHTATTEECLPGYVCGYSPHELVTPGKQNFEVTIQHELLEREKASLVQYLIERQMKFSVHMENTNAAEHRNTVDFLEGCRVSDLFAQTGQERTDPASDGSTSKFEFNMYVDNHEEIVDAMRVILFYNDRTPEQIEQFSVQLQAFLEATKY